MQSILTGVDLNLTRRRPLASLSGVRACALLVFREVGSERLCIAQTVHGCGTHVAGKQCSARGSGSAFSRWRVAVGRRGAAVTWNPSAATGAFRCTRLHTAVDVAPRALLNSHSGECFSCPRARTVNAPTLLSMSLSDASPQSPCLPKCDVGLIKKLV